MYVELGLGEDAGSLVVEAAVGDGLDPVGGAVGLRESESVGLALGLGTDAGAVGTPGPVDGSVGVGVTAGTLAVVAVVVGAEAEEAAGFVVPPLPLVAAPVPTARAGNCCSDEALPVGETAELTAAAGTAAELAEGDPIGSAPVDAAPCPPITIATAIPPKAPTAVRTTFAARRRPLRERSPADSAPPSSWGCSQVSSCSFTLPPVHRVLSRATPASSAHL